MLFERRHMISIRSLALFMSDVSALFFSIWLAAVARLGFDEGWNYIHSNELPLLTSVGIYLLVFYIGGLYERQRLVSARNLVFPSVVTVAVGLVLIILTFYARFELLIGRGVLFLAALFTLVLACSLRYAYRALAGYVVFAKSTLVVGNGKDAANIIRLIQQTNDPGCRIYGVITPGKAETDGLLEGVPVIGSVDNLKHFVDHYKAETLIVATPLSREKSVLKVLRPLRYAGLEILDYASFYEQIAQEIPLDHIDDEWLMHAAMNSSRIHIRKLKRIIDVSVAVAGLVLSFPIALIAACCVRLDSPGPIFYKQRRSGLDGMTYTLYKFRTMRADAEAGSGAVWAGKYDNRVTRVGRVLRKSRIDEIPQLVNVLRGEMSLVGPRPERPEFVDALAEAIPFYKERLLVPPGITGWAQIKFPYAASIRAARRKLQYDLYYIKHMSLFLDIVILLRTIKTILVGLRHSEDASAAEEDGDTRQAKLKVIPGGTQTASDTKTA